MSSLFGTNTIFTTLRPLERERVPAESRAVLSTSSGTSPPGRRPPHEMLSEMRLQQLSRVTSHVASLVVEIRLDSTVYLLFFHTQLQERFGNGKLDLPPGILDRGSEPPRADLQGS